MSEVTKGNGFVGYDHRNVTVSRDMESLYTDGYVNFGWTLEDTTTSLQNVGSVTLKLKRDRKIRNKAELSRLQRQFEVYADEIESLERSKTTGASVAAITIGIIGTAFMAGSVFSYLGGALPLCILLAVPGFIGWIIPYFCFVNTRRRRTRKVTPLIDKKYDELYEVCEKANTLLEK